MIDSSNGKLLQNPKLLQNLVRAEIADTSFIARCASALGLPRPLLLSILARSAGDLGQQYRSAIGNADDVGTIMRSMDAAHRSLTSDIQRLQGQLNGVESAVASLKAENEDNALSLAGKKKAYAEFAPGAFKRPLHEVAAYLAEVKGRVDVQAAVQEESDRKPFAARTADGDGADGQAASKKQKKAGYSFSWDNLL